MYRTIADFVNDRAIESANTLRVFNAIEHSAIEQRAFDHGKSIRELAWHITSAVGGVVAQAGLTVDAPHYTEPVPNDMATIIAAYEKASASLVEQVQKEWNDAKLPESLMMWGMSFTYGRALSGLVHHEIHHRAQVMTLMRLAGLRVPGIYGPSHEEMQERAAANAVEA